jgi:hypothetical protein
MISWVYEINIIENDFASGIIFSIEVNFLDNVPLCEHGFACFVFVNPLDKPWKGLSSVALCLLALFRVTLRKLKLASLSECYATLQNSVHTTPLGVVCTSQKVVPWSQIGKLDGKCTLKCKIIPGDIEMDQ